MINLSNLKAGQTKVVGDVKVTKMDDGYELNVANEDGGKIQYDRDAKVWTAILNGANHTLEGASAKTAVEIALEIIQASKAEKIQDEATPAVEPGEEPSEAAPEYEATWDVAIDVKGGMGPHRLAAAMALAASLGAVTTVTKTKAENGGYKGTTTLHVHGDADTIALVQLALPMFMQEAEKGGWNLSKDASRRTRLAGIHHSLGGFNARAAYARGFAGGVIEALSLELEDTNLVDKGSDLDKGAWRLGMDEGKVFGAEQLKELVNA